LDEIGSKFRLDKYRSVSNIVVRTAKKSLKIKICETALMTSIGRLSRVKPSPRFFVYCGKISKTNASDEIVKTNL